MPMTINESEWDRLVAENERLTAEAEENERVYRNCKGAVVLAKEWIAEKDKRIERLEGALEEIGSQVRECEMDDEDRERADFEQGYDMCVLTAREALQRDKEVEK